MEIRTLEYFLAVAREGGVTKAAEVLHITQPTLSRQLGQLERELGVLLFDRSGRSLKLTDSGLLLCRRTEEILELVAKTEEELSEETGDLEGTITIGGGEVGFMAELAKACGAFREAHPRVSFAFQTATADVVRERILDGSVDLGVLLEPVDKDRFDYVRLGEERWVVLMRADDPLAGTNAITRASLAELPICLPTRTAAREELVHWFGAAFDELDIAYLSDLTTTAANLAQQGLCYPIVVEGSVPDFWNRSDLVAIPLSPEVNTGCVLAWKRGQPMGAALSAFIDGMRERYER